MTKSLSEGTMGTGEAPSKEKQVNTTNRRGKWSPYKALTAVRAVA